MVHIKHILLDVSEEIKKILPDKLEKDLQDDEIICPVCHGFGIVKRDYNFGVKEDDIKKNFKLNWYDNEYLTLCPNCYFGRIKTCAYCGKPLPKQSIRCDCEEYKEHEEEENRIKYQKTINKAKEIELKDISEYIYDEESEQYFSDKFSFAEHWWELYQEGDHDCFNFDEYFEKYIPKVLWNCKEVKMSIDADSIIENACDDLHEDALDAISYEDKQELQDLLDEWCAKQTGTTTYYPCYKEYVRVQKEWFD